MYICIYLTFAHENVSKRLPKMFPTIFEPEKSTWYLVACRYKLPGESQSYEGGQNET